MLKRNVRTIFGMVAIGAGAVAASNSAAYVTFGLTVSLASSGLFVGLGTLGLLAGLALMGYGGWLIHRNVTARAH